MSSPSPSNMHVRVERVENIVPSEPTEECEVPLSVFDLYVATLIVKFIAFYPASPNEEDLTELIHRGKANLAKLLVPYHFVAGRLSFNMDEGRPVISCNRAGTVVVLASSDMRLQDFGDFRNLNPAAYRSFVMQPKDLGSENDYPLFMAQVTRLRGGGIALGMSWSHALMDGRSFGVFLVNFMHMMTQGSAMILPSVDRPCIMSEGEEKRGLLNFKELSSSFYEMSKDMKKRPATKKNTFVYSYSLDIVKAIKRHIMSEGNLPNCSNFQAMAALLWKTRTMALEVPDQEMSTLIVSVDISSKLNPPLPLSFAGNALWVVKFSEKAKTVKEYPLSYCVQKMQEGFAALTDEYIRSEMCKPQSPWVPGSLFLTSWMQFTQDQYDFGIGKPLYVTQVMNPNTQMDFAVLLPAANGGVNINVVLPEGHQSIRFREILYSSFPLSTKL